MDVLCEVRSYVKLPLRGFQASGGTHDDHRRGRRCPVNERPFESNDGDIRVLLLLKFAPLPQNTGLF